MRNLINWIFDWIHFIVYISVRNTNSNGWSRALHVTCMPADELVCSVSSYNLHLDYSCDIKYTLIEKYTICW